MRHYLTLLLALLASPALHAQESLMFDKMKTYCFGRYLVDIPVEAELRGQGNTYYATAIQNSNSVTNFRAKVTAALEKRKNEPGKRGFKYVKSAYPDNGDKQIIIGKADLWGHVAYSIDAFAMSEISRPGSGYFFYMSGEGFNDKDIEETILDYKNILSSVRYRPDREIPVEPGFCFENGFVANDGKTSQVETASLAFRLKNNQDVRIRIESDVFFKKQPSLLEKQKASRLDDRFPGMVKKIRAGQLAVNGMSGEESLAYFPSDDKTGAAHNFAWETLGEVGNPFKPDILLEITSGEGVAGVTGASSLTTKQIQTLYEAIVKTIRLRPTGDKAKPKTPANQPKPSSQLSLGTRVASGLPCPQSGMWRCERADAQEPERHFLAGQTLPAVMVPAKRSLWQTLTGAPESVAEDTYWALAQHDSDS